MEKDGQFFIVEPVGEWYTPILYPFLYEITVIFSIFKYAKKDTYLD